MRLSAVTSSHELLFFALDMKLQSSVHLLIARQQSLGRFEHVRCCVTDGEWLTSNRFALLRQ
jgi:hypothetical protein